MSFLLTSCQKNESDISSEHNQAYTFEANFNPPPYYIPDEEEESEFIDDSTFVTGILDIERGFVVKKNDQRYNWSTCYTEPGIDSVYLSSSLSYDLFINKVKLNRMNIEFYYGEDLSNLKEINDSTYIYEDYNILFDQLNDHKWDDNGFNNWTDCHNFGIVFPRATFGEHNPDRALNNNGFMLEFENFIFESLTIDPVTNQINFKIILNASIKEMSCGYWEIFRIENAKLESVINPTLS